MARAQFLTADDVDRPTDSMSGEPEIGDTGLLERAKAGDE